jgi:CrcB protein
MGVLTGVFALGNDPSQTMKVFLIVGVLGGFTTFSAFSLDSVMLWQRGEFALSLLYVLSTVVFSIGALVLGLWLVRVLSS